jgi:hypothetical protein
MTFLGSEKQIVQSGPSQSYSTRLSVEFVEVTETGLALE